MKEPKPRDRFIRALRLEKVDRVPRLYRMRRAAKEKIDRVFGISESETGLKLQPQLELHMGNDAIIYQIGINSEFSHHPIAPSATPGQDPDR
jgi:hypothetical protein